MDQSDEAHDNARIGQVIAEKYALKRLLGAGGMGAVYEAENTWTHRRVAIKLMRERFTESEEAVQRFMQEAQAATRIAHPNIVDVLDMGQAPNRGPLFIVQEFLTGVDLRTHLDQVRRLPAPETAEIIVPIVEALVAAHDRGVVHRDIKPENIFLAQQSNGDIVPKLIDFGVSKVTRVSAEGRQMTRVGTPIGTPNYMSPEQARGDGAIDARTDVWSIGVVLYEMLTGAPPFEAPSYNLLITRIITEPPPRIERALPEIPRPLADLVHRAIEPQLEARFASMAALRTAMLECAAFEIEPPPLPRRSTGGSTGRHVLSAPEAVRAEPPAAPAPARPPQPSATSAPPAEMPIEWTDGLDDPPRGSRARAVILALLALGVCGGLGYAWTTGAATIPGLPPPRPAATAPATPALPAAPEARPHAAERGAHHAVPAAASATGDGGAAATAAGPAPVADGAPAGHHPPHRPPHHAPAHTTRHR